MNETIFNLNYKNKKLSGLMLSTDYLVSFCVEGYASLHGDEIVAAQLQGGYISLSIWGDPHTDSPSNIIRLPTTSKASPREGDATLNKLKVETKRHHGKLDVWFFDVGGECVGFIRLLIMNNKLFLATGHPDNPEELNYTDLSSARIEPRIKIKSSTCNQSLLLL